MQIWQPNQSLQNGRFIIKKILGCGGFGVTYCAIEYPTSKLVVIKTLNQQQQSQADFSSRQVKFVNEALLLGRCHHPYIVKVNEMIEENGLWGMVMEYIAGQDLGVYLNQRGSLPEAEALRYINQVGTALEYVHQQGLLHRDVKPNNILLRRGTQEAVLIDFGLAREFTLGEPGSMTNARTEGYAPIEQYERRGDFAPYTDVYALAATLYTLLTNIIPIPAPYRKYAQLPPAKQHNPQISDRVNHAIVKGMALEPQDRPQTMGEFRELLGIANMKKEPLALDSRIELQPGNKSAEPQPPETPLSYPKLEALLKAKEWQQADAETYLIMLQAVERHKQGWMRSQELTNFPCNVIRELDKIWTKYSDNKFGLSIQQQIWCNISGFPEKFDNANFCNFGDYVGWRKNDIWLRYQDFSFSLAATAGHLPSLGYGSQRWDEWQASCRHFFPRINHCLNQIR